MRRPHADRTPTAHRPHADRTPQLLGLAPLDLEPTHQCSVNHFDYLLHFCQSNTFMAIFKCFITRNPDWL